MENLVCQIDTHKWSISVICCICWNLHAFWGDQMDPKSACRGPNSILMTGTAVIRRPGGSSVGWPEAKLEALLRRSFGLSMEGLGGGGGEEGGKIYKIWRIQNCFWSHLCLYSFWKWGVVPHFPFLVSLSLFGDFVTVNVVIHSPFTTWRGGDCLESLWKINVQNLKFNWMVPKSPK